MQESVGENNNSPELDSFSHTQEALLRGGDSPGHITTGRISSPRNGYRIRRSQNISSNYDGELTPLLQSDASSEASEDNVLSTYSTTNQDVMNTKMGNPEVPEPSHTTPTNWQNPEEFTGTLLRTRRDRVHSIEHGSNGSIIDEERAISFGAALKIPGVLEFSLCLFFAKLVSYTFLYWLPTLIMDTGLNVG